MNRKYGCDYRICPVKKSKTVPFKLYSQYYCLNIDILKCFDQMSHKIIFEKVPLANKYLYFIECWVMRPVIGFETSEGKGIKTKCPKGVLQGSIMGPLICNIVLDGLQDFIQDNLTTRYKRSMGELKYKLGKLHSSSNSYSNFQVFCIRYLDDILILGKCLEWHVKKIQSLLITFLSQRGLELKNAFIFQGKRLKPGMSFDYLGFTFKYSNLNSASFEKGKYTKTEFTPMSVAGETLTKYPKSRLYLLVKSSALKKLKNALRVQLSKKNGYLSVRTMIDKLNNILRGFLNYFSPTVVTKKQLLPINNLLHKLFYKYLLRKFSSVPKIYSFIKINFIDQNRFKDGNKVLLRVSDINPAASVFITPSNKFLAVNRYM